MNVDNNQEFMFTRLEEQMFDVAEENVDLLRTDR